MAVTSVAVAALTAALFGANAKAGPVAATARNAAHQTAAARTRHGGNGALLISAVHNPVVARALSFGLESAVVSSLSARQLAGQRVIYGYSGTTPPSSLLSLIRHGEVGGVIFFSGNYDCRSQFTAAVKEARIRELRVDQPGQRLSAAAHDRSGRRPGQKAARRTSALAEVDRRARHGIKPRQPGAQGGLRRCRQSVSYGLNVNLAPVLDVYRSRRFRR